MGGGVVTWVVCTGGTTEAGLPARRTYHIRTMYTIIYVLNQLHDTNKRVRRKIPKYVYEQAYKFQIIESKNMVWCTASWSRTKIDVSFPPNDFYQTATGFADKGSQILLL